MRVTLENDELIEKINFVEYKYQSIVQRIGASSEDINAIESEFIMQH